MLGAIPPLPLYAFMAWCSVKAQGQLYLYFYAMEYSPSREANSRLCVQEILRRV
jgi:hypothetical protein